MKRHYRDDLLRTLDNEVDNITELWKELLRCWMLHTGISVIAFCDSGNAGLIVEELLPHQEKDNLQG
jgi:hypothetical protein